MKRGVNRINLKDIHFKYSLPSYPLDDIFFVILKVLYTGVQEREVTREKAREKEWERETYRCIDVG